MRALSLVALLTIFPAVLTGQWKTDPHAKRLAWGNANVVMRPDTMHGVQIWASTSRVLSLNTPRRDFAARFEPDSIVQWLAYARQLVNATKAPTDKKARLVTPLLRATDGSRVYLIREQKKGKWADRVSVVFQGDTARSSWAVLAERGAAEEFTESLFQAASLSFYQPKALGLLEPNPADPLTCPRPLQTPRVDYPYNRAMSNQGSDVWLTFVVRADSTVDPASVTVLVSDGVEFTASAVRAVKSVRYQPATQGGHPVDALAFQKVTFLMGQ